MVRVNQVTHDSYQECAHCKAKVYNLYVATKEDDRGKVQVSISVCRNCVTKVPALLNEKLLQQTT